MFNRREAIQSAAALAAAGVGLGALAAGSESPLPKVGSPLRLPEPLTLLDGSRWSAAPMQGKTLVVYWWASWCPFCALQSPHIEALWRAQQAKGLQVLALSIDRQQAAAANYMKARGYSFPAGMLTPEVARLLPKPVGLPVLVVLKVAADGRNGTVVFAESGEMFPEDVEGLKKYL
ncbi:TlpA disulfide reductase family protein [Polaromonas sp.]|uniref:TlpA family protein disulfide reductase n=1 Tax=Polaromonas sp. TaxID=1869339 RepID=UPI00286BAD0B|nr:TlpA disulfide reductase family protein [Polaromonas sp.]